MSNLVKAGRNLNAGRVFEDALVFPAGVALFWILVSHFFPPPPLIGVILDTISAILLLISLPYLIFYPHYVLFYIVYTPTTLIDFIISSDVRRTILNVLRGKEVEEEW